MSQNINTTNQGNRSITRPQATGLQTALRDAINGFIGLTHNGITLTGMAMVMVMIAVSARPDLRSEGELKLLNWLQERQTTEMTADAQPRLQTEPAAADRATALSPSELPKQQANVAYWLSRKYRVAPEPLGVLVAEAFDIGERVRLDPTLLLAVMAIESRFNPFAQSPVGAQGLMQVLTRVHTEKYDQFGGQLAAFDPVSNLRVGARVLHDCVKRAGSIEGGLRLYVGAVSTDGSDYINKVMAEHLRIQSVALSKPMPTTFPIYRSEPRPEEATVETIAQGHDFDAQETPTTPAVKPAGIVNVNADVVKPQSPPAADDLLQS